MSVDAKRLLAAAVGLLLLVPLTPAGAQSDRNTVHVVNSRYDPQEIRIDPGESVTWSFDAPGHTVTADDGRFDFDPAGKLVPRGETRSFVFPVAEVVTYHCRVHGDPQTGMWGRVVVGDVPVPTLEPTPSPPPPDVRHVPEEYATIAGALASAGPGTVIEVAPGTYRQGDVEVRKRGITIRGGGESVVLDGAGRNTAFVLAADGVRIEQLTVRNFRHDGITVAGAQDFEISEVTVEGSGASGIAVDGALNGAIRRSVVRDSTHAGVAVSGCADCDLLIEDVLAEANAIGYLGRTTGGVVVRRSTFRDNATGIVLANVPTDDGYPGGGTHVVGNTITDNGAVDRATRGPVDDLGTPPGVGVWVAGGIFDRIEDNDISGHDLYGVVLTHFGGPSYGVRVTGNAAGSLAWDGAGANVCFAGNDHAASVPEGIEDLYPCDAPATVGVAQPQVDAEVFGAAAGVR